MFEKSKINRPRDLRNTMLRIIVSLVATERPKRGAMVITTRNDLHTYLSNTRGDLPRESHGLLIANVILCDDDCPSWGEDWTEFLRSDSLHDRLTEAAGAL